MSHTASTALPAFALLIALSTACSGASTGAEEVPTIPDTGPVTEDASQSQTTADAGDVDDAGDGDEEADASVDETPDAAEPPDAESWDFDDEERAFVDESELAGPRAYFDPTLITPDAGTSTTPAEFLAFPFPADHRRGADGNVRFDDFPRPNSLAQSIGDKLLDRYLAPVGGVDGFSLNGAVHVAFDEDLDLSAIPTAPEAFLERDAPFKIIDIDPSSPERGRLRPLRWEYQQGAGNYAAAHSLAIAPAWGFPLREDTTYALVITKDDIKGATSQAPLRQPLLLSALLANRAEKPAAIAGVTDELYESLRAAYAPLRNALDHDGIDIGEVAVATVFTTQTVSKNLRRIASHLSTDLRLGKWVPQATYARTERSYWSSLCTRTNNADTWATCTWSWADGEDDVTLYQLAATFNGRNYQQGEVPYLLSGGNFRFNTSNTPIGFREETLTLVVTVPEKPMQTSDGCIPIVEVAHGTGGSAYTTLGDRTASRLAARGLASVGMDQPLHGDRFDVDNYDIPKDGILGTLLSLATVQMTDKDLILELVNFNFLNVDSARTSMRQSAVDTMALTHLIKTGGLDVPAEFSPTGEAIRFCREKIGFFGHSQGALSGAIAAGPEHRIGAWLLSAGGGGLGITILDRKDFGDFPTILGTLFGLNTSGGEILSEMHVLMTAIQTVVDVTDPINYAPFWMSDEKLGQPTSQLLTSGLNDSQTPHRSARALAAAARLSPINPIVLELPEFAWAGVTPLDAPVSGNNPTSTNAFIQWDGADKPDDVSEEYWSGHFLVYDRPEAINASMRFLKTYFAPESSDGLPLIERDPAADVKSSPGKRARHVIESTPTDAAAAVRSPRK